MTSFSAQLGGNGVSMRPLGIVRFFGFEDFGPLGVEEAAAAAVTSQAQQAEAKSVHVPWQDDNQLPSSPHRFEDQCHVIALLPHAQRLPT
eukprot:CAMPEP_0178376868 /NCGR_PEP_ID=MMETSP0689_2-20121128/3625_1 /TAXON_ID=160604 /ORGANISM="Amphidinium massartii, Strain CS-259" /LENGTH=89 /DNA_ID=CAMNT_0019996905 /DNA_START=564 /DNA_END=834 /DNA_ORIENTATION=+